MSSTCSWLRPDACLLSGGPELPVPVFLPHKVKLFSQGNPHFYFLINQVFPVPLAQQRGLLGCCPRGRVDFLGGSARGLAEGPHLYRLENWALKQEMSRALTRAAPSCSQLLSLGNQSREQRLPDTGVVTGGGSRVSLPIGPS